MAFPPEPVMKQYLQFLHEVLVTARLMAGRGDSVEMITDLLDAIHELPDLISRWESFRESTFQEIIKNFDTKWPSEKRRAPGLVETWEKCSKP